MEEIEKVASDGFIKQELSEEEEKERLDELEKQWQNISIRDDFLFQKLMNTQPDILKEVASVLLDKKVKNIVSTEIDKKMTGLPHSKFVRMDVYLEDEEKMINLEMQVRNYPYLIKRIRYYGGLMDSSFLEKGKSYSSLPERYVVFICTFDVVGNKKALNTFQNRNDDEEGAPLGDGSHIMIYNTKGNQSGLSEKVCAFLDFVNGKGSSSEPLVQILKEKVLEIKMNEQWRNEFMTSELNLRDRIDWEMAAFTKEVAQQIADAERERKEAEREKEEEARKRMEAERERMEAERGLEEAERGLEEEARKRKESERGLEELHKNMLQTAKALIGTFTVEQIADMTKLSCEEILALE